MLIYAEMPLCIFKLLNEFKIIVVCHDNDIMQFELLTSIDLVFLQVEMFSVQVIW